MLIRHLTRVTLLAGALEALDHSGIIRQSLQGTVAMEVLIAPGQIATG